jgi:hypothetical protein
MLWGMVWNSHHTHWTYTKVFPELFLEVCTLDYVVEDILDTIDIVQALTYITGPAHVNKNNSCSLKLHPGQALSYI